MRRRERLQHPAVAVTLPEQLWPSRLRLRETDPPHPAVAMAASRTVLPHGRVGATTERLDAMASMIGRICSRVCVRPASGLVAPAPIVRAPSGGTTVDVLLFDLGDTLIHEQVDDRQTLDEMDLELRDGAASIVGRLADRYAMAVVTDTETSPVGSVRRALERLGIGQYFDVIVTSVDLGVRKPSPAIFNEALRRLAASPDEAVMIGNDPHHDIEGAHNAGMRTILYRDSRYYRPGSVADHEVDELRDIPALLERLERDRQIAEADRT